MDDSAHLALNDGSPTYSSHSYHTDRSLGVTWPVETLKLGHLLSAGVDSFTGHWKPSTAHISIKLKLSIDDLDESGFLSKKIIFKAAGQAIPRDYKRPSPFFSLHKSSLLQPLLEEK
ncbi:hypothetical protein TNCV_283351 [Trichonephila clavipes]|nr:hypothetical protein TNCV_283351 [Trichonephila clavipes]